MLKVHFSFLLLVCLSICANAQVREVLSYKGGPGWTAPLNNSFLHTHGSIFRTQVNIKYKSPHSLEEEIFARLDSIDRSVNPFNEHSTIYKVNNNLDVELDDWFISVFEQAQLVSKISDGLYDITAAPLINRWGFGTDKIYELPSQAEIDSLLKFVGYKKIRVENRRIVKEDPRIQLNASSIAKGFAVDLIAELLDSYEIPDYLVEIGGEVRVKGNNPDNEAWLLEIIKPIDDNTGQIQEREAVIAIHQGALASSGNTANYYIKENKKYAHTINPVTGYPAESEILIATVLYPECTLADAFATAFMAMPMSLSIPIANSIPNMKYIFLFRDEEGKIQTVRN
ncbi:FAD:protein FMN transferase [Bacteroidales bacterium OttesenSCG-928-A17]|nr:FAD:protein FMN transferase [Bacteroidales bacterium OttesenSCG-928-A17]